MDVLTREEIVIKRKEEADQVIKASIPLTGYGYPLKSLFKGDGYILYLMIDPMKIGLVSSAFVALCLLDLSLSCASLMERFKEVQTFIICFRIGKDVHCMRSSRDLLLRAVKKIKEGEKITSLFEMWRLQSTYKMIPIEKFNIGGLRW